MTKTQTYYVEITYTGSCSPLDYKDAIRNLTKKKGKTYPKDLRWSEQNITYFSNFIDLEKNSFTNKLVKEIFKAWYFLEIDKNIDKNPKAYGTNLEEFYPPSFLNIKVLSKKNKEFELIVQTHKAMNGFILRYLIKFCPLSKVKKISIDSFRTRWAQLLTHPKEEIRNFVKEE